MPEQAKRFARDGGFEDLFDLREDHLTIASNLAAKLPVLHDGEAGDFRDYRSCARASCRDSFVGLLVCHRAQRRHSA